LTAVIDKALSAGWIVGNIDTTVVAQQPKLAPYLEQIVANIARHCQVTAPQINVKATTTEKLGFTGRQEGIAAHAVVIMVANDTPQRKVVAQL
jgi:2-C-methyl-D-erythritol 2,4-cyclodiphosphate synthase